MPIGYTSIPLANLQFLGVSGSATISGMYLDSTGNQLGIAFTLSVPQGNGTNAPVGLPSIPATAISAQVQVATHAVYYSAGALVAANVTDFTTNYTNYPEIATNVNVSLGAELL